MKKSASLRNVSMPAAVLRLMKNIFEKLKTLNNVQIVGVVVGVLALIATTITIVTGYIGDVISYYAADNDKRDEIYVNTFCKHNAGIGRLLNTKCSPIYWDKSGKELETVNKFPEAIKKFTISLLFDPSNPDYLIDRGYARYLNGDAEGAVADYTEAMKSKKDDAWLYRARGDIFYDQKDKNGDGTAGLRKATSDYSRAISIDNTYADAYGNRGDAYYSLGQYELAERDYDAAIKFESKSDAKSRYYYWLGRSYDNENKIDEAIDMFEKAVIADPKNTEYRQMLCDELDAKKAHKQEAECLGQLTCP